MRYLFLWIFGAIVYLFFTDKTFESVIGSLTALIVCCLSALLVNKLSIKKIAYVFFFTITLTSLLGITETLTGSHAVSTQPFLLGLSFYTASLAYLIYTENKINMTHVAKVSNPLLLATGPIALFIKDYRYRSFFKRFNYYFPYIIVGLFFYQIIALPITKAFDLIDYTDLVSSLTFAIIFEIFVYANFCGLSLIIFGLFGLFGYKVPLNFRQPFTSTNLVDFWKGWHVSLSPVLKELFYKPLRKRYPASIALIGVYLASALWHGVSFNFLLWGLFHALMFILTIFLLKKQVKYLPVLIMIMAVILGRLLFADSQSNRLLEKLTFSYQGFEPVKLFFSELPSLTEKSIILGFIFILIEFFCRNFKSVAKRNYKYLRTPSALFFLILIGIIFVSSDTGVNFAVYGQR